MKDAFVLISNTFWQMLAKASSVLLSFITITVLTRYLGVAGYGNFNLVFTYLSFFGVLADLGINLLFVKEYTRTNNSSIIVHFFVSKLALVLFSLTLSLVFIPVLPYAASVKMGLLIGAFAVSVGYLNGFGYTILQSKVKLSLVALYESINRFITVAFLFLFIHLNLGFLYILASVLIGNIVSFILAIITIEDFTPKRLQLSLPHVKKSIIMALPIGITGVFSALYFRIDTLILSFYRSPSDLGIYSLAYKLLENILVLWGLYMASFYPMAAKYFQQNKKSKFIFLFRQTIIVLISLSFVILLFAYVGGLQGITLLAGDKFKDSIIPFKLLSLAVPFFLLNNVFYHVLLISDKVQLILYSMIFALIFSLILNILLIPHYGYYGASITTVVTEICLSVIYITILKKKQIL